MKKLKIALVTIILGVCLLVFAACGESIIGEFTNSGDTGNGNVGECTCVNDNSTLEYLLERLRQLEQEVEKLNSVSRTDGIYEIGDTANVYNGGLLLFSIYFERLGISTFGQQIVIAQVTNHILHSRGNTETSFFTYLLNAENNTFARQSWGERFPAIGSTRQTNILIEGASRVIFSHRAFSNTVNYSDGSTGIRVSALPFAVLVL